MVILLLKRPRPLRLPPVCVGFGRIAMGSTQVPEAVGGSATTLALVPPRGGMWESVGIDTRISLFSDAIDTDHTRLLDRGVDADPHILRLGPGVPAMFELRDPDGNTVHIIERHPTAT